MSEMNDYVIDNLCNALAVLDECGKIVRVNPRFCELFHLDSKGDSKGWEGVAFSDAIEDDSLTRMVARVIADGDEMQEVEFAICAGKSRERHFLLSISRHRPPSGRSHTFVTFDEVTEWRSRQLQLMEASRLASIGEMVSGIAHEINNPMAAVMGFSQLVLRRDLEPSVRRDVMKIFEEGRRASKIFTDLQAFAHTGEAMRDYVDAADMVRRVLDFRGYELRVHDIDVVTDLGSVPATVLAERSKIEQALLNLVTNAEQFMAPQGGGTLTVKLTAGRDVVRISIADDGPGIPEQHLPKIFDPFFTTTEVGGGKGLGLSVSHGIIRDHGGSITAISAPNQGAEFIVELPFATDPATLSAELEPAGPAAASSPMKVLVVDDEPSISELISRALCQFGHVVDVSSSAEEAIETRDIFTYDLIILDMKMPGMGGAGMYNHIKQLSEELSSRVLFVTGDTNNPMIADVKDRTGSPLLTKPFNLEDLMILVDQLAPGNRGSGTVSQIGDHDRLGRRTE